METTKKSHKRSFSFLTFMVGFMVLILVLFAIAVIIIGYFAFTQSFTNEYTDYVYRIASSGAKEVDGDYIDTYLEHTSDEMYEIYDSIGSKKDKEDLTEEEYMAYTYVTTEDNLSQLCNNMNMAVVYVIRPSEDYQQYTSIFNCLNANSKFDKWELGHVTDTSSDDYITAYKKILNGNSEGETIERINNLGEGEPHITALVPVKDSKGNVTAIICAQRNLGDLNLVRQNFIQGVGALAVILVILVIILSARFLKRDLIDPITIISMESDRFAKEKTRVEDGTLSHSICKVNEVNNLAHSIDQMEKDTVQYIEDITVFTGEKERLGAELDLASNIQIGMLPTVEQMLSEKKGYSIYASTTPAREVGGDFFDFYMMDDTHLVILIADVSDKGVGAAFFMAIAKTLIRARAGMGGSATEIITYVDKMISERNSEGMFVTVWMAIIDLSTGHVDVCNAGHDYPAIMFGSDDYIIQKGTRHGPPVGFIPGARFIQSEFEIAPGDRIFLYTDGLNEAKRSDGERFGLDRLVTVLNAHKEESNEKLIANMKDAVRLFVGSEPQFDDMTMLSFTFEEKI